MEVAAHFFRLHLRQWMRSRVAVHWNVATNFQLRRGKPSSRDFGHWETMMSRMRIFLGVFKLSLCSVTTPQVPGRQDVVTLDCTTTKMGSTRFMCVRVHSCSCMALAMVVWVVHCKELQRCVVFLNNINVDAMNHRTKQDMAFIDEHIQSFPSYTSHYSGSDNPNRKYLSPDVTSSKIYSLYRDTCNK